MAFFWMLYCVKRPDWPVTTCWMGAGMTTSSMSSYVCRGFHSFGGMICKTRRVVSGPSLGSAAFEVLSLCRAEAALGQGQKGEAPFPFTHFAQRLPLPRLYMPPGSWLLVTALHRHCLFFCLCVTFPTASRGPLCPLLPLPLLSGLILCLSYSLFYLSVCQLFSLKDKDPKNVNTVPLSLNIN